MKSIQSRLLWLAGTVFVFAGCAWTQSPAPIPRTRFTCQGRASGYYADVDTGCQVYHMCDGLGRQFSYSCPNTTLFQQRMLICDHWYMVNCSKAESNYDANLLIGQRDKPFVSEQEMALRTPRPDILTVPYNHNYYDGLKQAETKYPSHPGNSIHGESDNVHAGTYNGIDSNKNQYTPTPAHWSTHLDQHHGNTNDIEEHRSSTPTPVSLSIDNRPSRPTTNFNQNSNFDHRTQPSTINLQYTSSTIRSTETDGLANSDEFQLDIRMKEEEPVNDNVYNFIKRFDPNSPASNTGMTTTEILQINGQLPASSDASAEESTGKVSRRKSISAPNNFNTFQASEDKNRPTSSSVIRTANTKPSNQNENFGGRLQTLINGQPIQSTTSEISVPDRILQPPKDTYPILPSSTMGPPIYYEWKWAVPAFDLEPPKAENDTIYSTASTLDTSESGRPNFKNLTTRSSSVTPRTLDTTSSTERPEYKLSSYFVPDYIFPLDKAHPGYLETGAQTSFQVNVPEQGRSFGENPNCPQCHPAYLIPGSCEPCIVKR